MKPLDCMLLLCVTTFTAVGCYRYTPVESPQPGMDVRAQLETEAAVRRSQGMDDPTTRYDGVIVDVTAEQLTLDVLIARSSSVFQDVEIRDTIQLRTSEIRSIMQRTLSPGRTALLVAGMGAAAVLVVMGIDAISGGTTDDGGEPPPGNLRVPIASWTGGRLVPAILGARRED
jgi:hypothetical protein